MTVDRADYSAVVGCTIGVNPRFGPRCLREIVFAVVTEKHLKSRRLADSMFTADHFYRSKLKVK